MGVENLAESISQCPSPLARVARISYNSSSNTVSSHDGDNLNDITYLGKHQTVLIITKYFTLLWQTSFTACFIRTGTVTLWTALIVAM